MQRLGFVLLVLCIGCIGCGERSELRDPDDQPGEMPGQMPGELPDAPPGAPPDAPPGAPPDAPPGAPPDASPDGPPPEDPPPDDPPDDLPPPDEVTGGDPLSGSRIKARWHATDDGFRSFQGWFDSQLGVSCAWTGTADGTRCVPTTALDSNTTFLDAQCTRPAAVFTPTSCNATRPAYIGRTTPLSCSIQVTTVSAVGARVSASQVFTNALGGCAAIAVPGGAEVYATDGAVPLSTFVKASPGLETGSGRFANAYLHGEDGARVITGLRDTTLATACMLTTAAGEVRCVPSLASPITGFSDASCRTAIVEKDGGSCTTPAATVSIPDPPTCSFRVFQRGADFSGPLVFGPVGGTCTTIPAPEYPHQLVGAEVAVPVLPPLASASRLRVKVRFGGFTTRTQTIRDTQLGFNCLPLLRGVDGVRRCLPSPSQQAHRVYTDAACTQAIHVAIVTPTTCTTPVPRFVTLPDAPICTDGGQSSKLRVFPVTTQITAPLFTKGVSCQPLVLGSSRAYAVGPEEPASSFQRIELVTDP
jgi:hypothetical protein